MSIVLNVPNELKFMLSALEAALTLVSQTLAQISGRRGGHSVDYQRIECAIADAVAQIECAANQGVLQSLDVDAPRLLIRGETYERVGRDEGSYFTMAGPCLVRRSLYQQVGQPEGPVVDPISLRAGVVQGGWLPQTAQAMAHQVQMNTAREAQQTAKVTRRLPYSDSSFDRVTHAVGALYLSHEQNVEQKLIEAYQIPEEVTGVAVSLDRVSVPMQEAHPNNPGAIIRAYRMAFCGTVTLHDRKGRAVDTIRYGRMPHGDPLSLMEAMVSDVDVMRQQRPDLLVSTLADGAADVWALLDAYINKEQLNTEVARLIDLWHNIEKLGKAARVIHGEQHSGAVVVRWQMLLLNDSEAADQILKELLASNRQEARVGETRPVHEAITYLENHRDQMDYAAARRQGRPVGSGPVEASCKSLFEVRMKRSGSRWKPGTGDDIVRLRALALSDRWDAAMPLVLEPLRTGVRRAA